MPTDPTLMTFGIVGAKRFRDTLAAFGYHAGKAARAMRKVANAAERIVRPSRPRSLRPTRNRITRRK